MCINCSLSGLDYFYLPLKIWPLTWFWFLAVVSCMSFIETEKKPKQNNKYRQWRGLVVIHTYRSYVHPPRADSSDFGLLGAKFSKMGDSLPRTPLNQRAKFDGEIHKRTNKNKQTVNHISTLCLSACVDNKSHCST